MIKNIEELKKIQIVCKRIDQVEDCYNHLEQLGFKVSYYSREGFFFIIRYKDELSGFSNYGTMAGDKYIEFYNKKLVKTLQKFIKEKEKQEKVKDFEVAEDGRIIKVNNWMSEKQIFLLFIRDKAAGTINRFSQDCLIKYVNLGFVYATEQARDKAVFKMEIETKLKNIAERLNAGRKIDWEDTNQEKNYIYYSHTNKIVSCQNKYWCQDLGVIHCLDDKNFLEVAKQEIGEDNLIKYFKE